MWKLSVNLRPEESEGLKGVYGLKFFYQADDKKSFFTQWCAHGKDVFVCGHENSDKDNELSWKNIAMMKMRSGDSALSLTGSGLMNSFFTISFTFQS